MTVNRFVLDSDILIEHLRGREEAKSYLAQLSQEGELLVSVMTVAELVAGIRHSREEKGVDALLRLVRAVPIDESIARRGGNLRRQYHQSHGTGLVDALIAATAEQTDAPLVSFNRRHFPMIANFQLPYER